MFIGMFIHLLSFISIFHILTTLIKGIHYSFILKFDLVRQRHWPGVDMIPCLFVLVEDYSYNPQYHCR